MSIVYVVTTALRLAEWKYNTVVNTLILANVRYMLSPVHPSSVVCVSSVCLSSVTLVHPNQAVEIFDNISTAFGTLAIRWHPPKILRDCPAGTPPPGELNSTGVAKYSDFGPIEGYISEKVQDRR